MIRLHYTFRASALASGFYKRPGSNAFSLRSVEIIIILNEKTFRLKNRSKRRGQNWANQTHTRKEIKLSDHHFLIYANVICRFCIFLMCTRHIRKTQKLQTWYVYIKKWWSENFISFLLCVWLGQFCPRHLDLVFLTERFFLLIFSTFEGRWKTS